MSSNTTYISIPTATYDKIMSFAVHGLGDPGELIKECSDAMKPRPKRKKNRSTPPKPKKLSGQDIESRVHDICLKKLYQYKTPSMFSMSDLFQKCEEHRCTITITPVL